MRQTSGASKTSTDQHSKGRVHEMSSVIQQPPLKREQVFSQLQHAANKVVPIKIGWFGPQGSGKTTSAALLSLALSKEVYGGAPVYVTDTEPGWQFLRPLF